MKGHEEIRQILASYGDASPAEQAAADAHLAVCDECAERFAAYQQVESLLFARPDPALPSRLARPFAAILREASAQQPRGASAFVFGRGLAPAAIILVLLVALSVFVWSGNTRQPPATSTPTQTMTLTPTSITARETGPATLTAFRAALELPVPAPEMVPTPAPAPAPVAGNSAILFAGLGAHATIAH
jgi:anti-sigma factor RsiW